METIRYDSKRIGEMLNKMALSYLRHELDKIKDEEIKKAKENVETRLMGLLPTIEERVQIDISRFCDAEFSETLKMDININLKDITPIN